MQRCGMDKGKSGFVKIYFFSSSPPVLRLDNKGTEIFMEDK